MKRGDRVEVRYGCHLNEDIHIPAGKKGEVKSLRGRDAVVHLDGGRDITIPIAWIDEVTS